jgi:hypothetical protein
MIMNLGKRMLKKSALACYKRDLRQVSLQTVRDRAVCKTQAGNVFKDCLTEAAGSRATNEKTPESEARRCNRRRESCLAQLYLLLLVPVCEIDL